ncbi:MAG: M15 family metallopeptidase [Bacteroidota bacterium]
MAAKRKNKYKAILLLSIGSLIVIGFAGFFIFRECITTTSVKEVDTALEANRKAKLLSVYGEQIKAIRDNRIWFRDGSTIVYDTRKRHPNYLDSLNNADVQDQFAQSYTAGETTSLPLRNHDPGRLRCDTFFKKMYGATPEAVQANLEEIVWCPKMVGQTIRINKRNGVAEAVKKISAELDGDTTLKPFLSRIGGSFTWRKIAGTNRNSTHSYGITIDINTSQSHYWQWDCKCTDEYVSLTYRNKIPWKIVKVFEKYGFVWGGKWYHYDTMHFEYRPELL